VVHFACFPGLEDNGNACSRACPDEVMVQAGDCEEGRNRGVFAIDLPVGQNEEIDSTCDRPVRRPEENVESCL
jgi:hypothetical protein